MDPDLSAFLARHTAFATGTAIWGGGLTHLELHGFHSTELPPLHVVTSVRCVVLRGDEVVVVRNDHGLYLVPGGRREVGETVEQTLRREIIEEVGWSIRDPVLIGFVHFHHLTPQQAGYSYPYPDFVHLIFAADADRWIAEPIGDGDGSESSFLPIADVLALDLAPNDRAFLEAALRAKRGVERAG